MADEKLVYLDTSAFVKLVIPEPETVALVTALTSKALLVASEILEVEALRATRRSTKEDGVAAARTQLAGVRLLPLTDQIRRRACELEPPTLRSLDAIHIATALDLGERLECMYAYDVRMATAANEAGLRVLAPTADQPSTERASAGEPADPDTAEKPRSAHPA
ncbi:MAG TPA: type II toxin-antitoxin system VapC family toxin [Solirubrobacteraceae bacterium]|nr:type II toxin-antitoxin system VapC family toxin [Solirubrobacteraceae bacterium]